MHTCINSTEPDQHSRERKSIVHRHNHIRTLTPPTFINTPLGLLRAGSFSLVLFLIGNRFNHHISRACRWFYSSEAVVVLKTVL